MNTGEKALLVGGIAVGGYFVYQTFFANTLPSDAEYVEQIPTGTAVAVPSSWASGGTIPSGSATTQVAYLYYSPSMGMLYTSYTAPTSSTPTYSSSSSSTPTNPVTTTPTSTNGTTLAPTSGSTTSTSTSSSPTTSTTTPASSATYPLPGGGTAAVPTTLAGLWSAIQAWVAQDTNFTDANGVYSGTGDHWMFYLPYIWAAPPSSYTGGAWPPAFTTVFPGVSESQVMTQTQFWTNGMLPYLQGQGLSGYGGLGCGCGGDGGVGTFLLGGSLAVLGLLALANWGQR